jgi:integrase
MVSPWRGFTRDYPQWTWVSPHVLRHTFITLGLRSGMSVWDVAGIAGASPITVQRVYGHHSADDRARALLDRRHSQSTSGIAAA